MSEIHPIKPILPTYINKKQKFEIVKEKDKAEKNQIFKIILHNNLLNKSVCPECKGKL